MPYHDSSPAQVMQTLQTSPAGLTALEAKIRLEHYGPNEIEKKGKQSMIGLFFSQFTNVLVIILLLATIISIVLNNVPEAIAMGAIILLSAVLGFVQEYKAEKAIEALEELSSPNATIIRDGRPGIIRAREVVPGDIIVLEEGDIVPADIRLSEVSHLQIEEAALTGESVPSSKVITNYSTTTPVADQENIAFSGTTVTYGKGTGIVYATGMKTEFGKIAHSLQTHKETKTPLQNKFEQLSLQIGIAVAVLILVIFGVGLLRGEASIAGMLLIALSLAVAAVPSALPAIVTISLSMGAKNLAKKRMIIKKLPAAESLGSITYICTDKTGTLTKNEMTVTKLFANNTVVNVSGTGYDPEGVFNNNKKVLNESSLSNRKITS